MSDTIYHIAPGDYNYSGQNGSCQYMGKAKMICKNVERFFPGGEHYLVHIMLPENEDSACIDVPIKFACVLPGHQGTEEQENEFEL